MRYNIKRTLFDYLGITVGAAIASLSLAVFLIPNRIAAGGLSGLSTIIFYMTGFPVGTMTLILNIPVFLAGLKVLGFSFGARTIYGMIMFSVFIDVFQSFINPITTDLLLATIYGGIIGGLGLGIVFLSRGTTGGTDMIARLIHHYTSLSVGQGLLLADGFVVLMAGIFFNAEVALYAAIAIFINSKTIDLVQEGIDYKRAAFIISRKSDEIKNKVIKDLDRGVTIFKAKGGYTAEEKEVLYCIINRSELTKIKRLVYDIDNDAFVIISSVHEVLGEGFKKIN
ncbi:YitT family protein [Natronospora cellulosivora (SeqCode)]